MLTCILETGIDVNPRRALEAFCMCEQTCARLTRDILAAVVVGICPRRAAAAGGRDGRCDDESDRVSGSEYQR